MINTAISRNLRIAVVLSVCYLLGMFASYYTTETLRMFRGGTNVQAEHELARVGTSP